MKKTVAKILLISDLHWLTVPVGTQKEQRGSISFRVFERIMNVWKRYCNRIAVPRLLRIISGTSTEFDRTIVNGDFVECEWNEQGMVTNHDCDSASEKRNKIMALAKETSFGPGDHELGYRSPIGSDPLGGMSRRSIDNFMRVLGPLWATFSCGKTHLILLCSSLMIQKTNHLEYSEEVYIKELHDKQRKFLEDTLRVIPEGETVLVFLHDPDAISVFYNYVCESYDFGNKNIRIFCGHMHAEFTVKAYEILGNIALSNYANLLPHKVHLWARENKMRLGFFKKYDMQIIPAPGGMMGFGGGFMVLNVYDNGEYKLERHGIWTKRKITAT